MVEQPTNNLFRNTGLDRDCCKSVPQRLKVANMGKSAQKSPRKRMQARKATRQETVFYVIAIDNWEWSFTFGVSSIREDEGAYADYRQLLLCGRLLAPSSVKAETVELALLPNEELNLGQERDRHQPISIGSVHVAQGHMSALISIPADALPSILTMVTAEVLRFAVLTGSKLRYGRTAITRMRLEMKLGEDDLPTDERHAGRALRR